MATLPQYTDMEKRLKFMEDKLREHEDRLQNLEELMGARGGVGSVDLSRALNPDQIAQLEISQDGRSIRTRGYLRTGWQEINNGLRSLGYRWVSEGKNSHWAR